MDARKAVVLLSGGLDSAVALAVARADGFIPHCLSFDYGQRHRHELEAAARVTAHLGAREHRTVRIDLRAIGGSALTADLDVPKDDPGAPVAPGVPVTYVPARNLVFMSVAAGYAEVVGARDLFVGVNVMDYSGYPDCREEFIRAFEEAARLGTRLAERGEKLEVRTPLIRLSKAGIIRRGAELGVDFGLTHSCYDPVVRTGTVLACGRCDSCRIRARGFAEAGVPDPTRYAEGAP